MELLTTPFLPLRISKRLKCGYFKFKLQKNIHEYSWILEFHEKWFPEYFWKWKFRKSGDFVKKCRFLILQYSWMNPEKWRFKKTEISKMEILKKMEIWINRDFEKNGGLKKWRFWKIWDFWKSVDSQIIPKWILKSEVFEKVEILSKWRFFES